MLNTYLTHMNMVSCKLEPLEQLKHPATTVAGEFHTETTNFFPGHKHTASDYCDDILDQPRKVLVC